MNFILTLISKINHELKGFTQGFKKSVQTSATASKVMKDEEALKRANRLARMLETAVKNSLEAHQEKASGIGSLAFAHSKDQYVVEGFAWLEKLNGVIEVATYTLEGTKSGSVTIVVPTHSNPERTIAKKFRANLKSRGFCAFNFRFITNY